MQITCILCGERRWARLPDPGPQSIASDWRIVDEPLGKVACDGCGLARRTSGTRTGHHYEDGYSLYAHAPGEPIESARQSQYASWIAGAVRRMPRRVLDVGCGNGSLLRALREHWPVAELHGCDPSSDSVAHATGDGLRVWRGTADDLPTDLDADVIVSVNVIEHASQPVEFANALRRAAAADATIVVVCPDGSRPGVELLFADHLWSLTSGHLPAIFCRAGIATAACSVAPVSLGAFQMVVGTAVGHASNGVAAIDAQGLNRRRAAYLERWRALDGRLCDRLPVGVVCFGAGEAAGLLRAYAPAMWARVGQCAVDRPGERRFGGVPVTPLEDVPSSAHILVAVHPRDQETIAGRLRERFAHVTTWYDLLGETW